MSAIECKKPKMEQDAPAKTCAHWVQRKKRYCKMSVSKGRDYCGEHEPASDETAGEDVDERRARIPCPLDDKHTVYEKNLQKHLKICNAREKEEVPAYIEKGINAGDELNGAEESDADVTANVKLSELTDEEFYAVVDKIKELYEKYVAGKIETLQVQHNSLDDELAKAEYGKESRKHLLQAAALLGVLDSENQLADSTSFIEFGAGKGQLAYYLSKLLEKRQNSQVVLLDRMSLRHKKDNKIEDKSLVQRIRVDIADFRIDGLELLQKTKRIVAVSKHLCGAATDLTLRCILQNSTLTTDAAKPTTIPATEFIMIALCCHHRCEWRSFVGKEFFRAHALTQRQFIIITKMVSWAICGTGMSRERRRALEEQSLSPPEMRDNNTTQRLPLKERERIGFMCKRILDYARLDYLRQHGYEAALKYYVPRDITLENVSLLARKL